MSNLQTIKARSAREINADGPQGPTKQQWMYVTSTEEKAMWHSLAKMMRESLLVARLCAAAVTLQWDVLKSSGTYRTTAVTVRWISKASDQPETSRTFTAASVSATGGLQRGDATYVQVGSWRNNPPDLTISFASFSALWMLQNSFAVGGPPASNLAGGTYSAPRNP